MKVLLSTLLAFLLIFGFANCNKSLPPDELSKLPAATQHGANTFGCLINGIAWTSDIKCAILCDPDVSASYDPIYEGFLVINAYRLSQEIDQNISLSMDSSDLKRSHSITIEKRLSNARYINYQNSGNCGSYERLSDSSTVHSGIINITRYDFTNGIISGNFEFSLVKPNCETLNVTNGRFDIKLF